MSEELYRQLAEAVVSIPASIDPQSQAIKIMEERLGGSEQGKDMLIKLIADRYIVLSPIGDGTFRWAIPT
jgi:hypothetical protein